MSAEVKEQLQKIMPDAFTGTVTKATSPIVNNLEASINGMKTEMADVHSPVGSRTSQWSMHSIEMPEISDPA